MKNAFNAFLAFHKLASDPVESHITAIQVVTPENIPKPSRAV
jgi:hypothetical protein